VNVWSVDSRRAVATLTSLVHAAAWHACDATGRAVLRSVLSLPSPTTHRLVAELVARSLCVTALISICCCVCENILRIIAMRKDRVRRYRKVLAFLDRCSDDFTASFVTTVEKYTGCAKKVNPKCCTHNFVKYWPTLKILSPLQSPENLQCSGH